MMFPDTNTVCLVPTEKNKQLFQPLQMLEPQLIHSFFSPFTADLVYVLSSWEELLSPTRLFLHLAAADSYLHGHKHLHQNLLSVCFPPTQSSFLWSRSVCFQSLRCSAEVLPKISREN